MELKLRPLSFLPEPLPSALLSLIPQTCSSSSSSSCGAQPNPEEELWVSLSSSTGSKLSGGAKGAVERSVGGTQLTGLRACGLLLISWATGPAQWSSAFLREGAQVPWLRPIPLGSFPFDWWSHRGATEGHCPGWTQQSSRRQPTPPPLSLIAPPHALPSTCCPVTRSGPQSNPVPRLPPSCSPEAGAESRDVWRCPRNQSS